MQTDHLFYEFFRQYPQAFLKLIQQPIRCDYTFSSPVLKRTERRMDGLFQPVDLNQPHFVAEFQASRDDTIYLRGLEEALRLHNQRPELAHKPWYVVIIFLDEAHDPGRQGVERLINPDDPWLISGTLGQFLHSLPYLPPELLAMKPLISNETEIRQQASMWMESVQQAALDPIDAQNLVDFMIEYSIRRLTELSPQEIERMFKLTPIEQTRTGRELIAKGLEQGLEQGLAQGLAQSIIDIIQARFGAPSLQLVQQIQQIDDVGRLRQLLTAVALAPFETDITTVVNQYL